MDQQLVGKLEGTELVVGEQLDIDVSEALETIGKEGVEFHRAHMEMLAEAKRAAEPDTFRP